MTKKENQEFTKDDFDDLNEICEECQIKDQSVTQNLILVGLKVCNSCRISKNLFPI
jgi:hypothetical protein